MDIVVLPSDGCLGECSLCPYSSKKPSKKATIPNEIPEGLLIFCPGSLAFPELISKAANLARMSTFSVLMAPLLEEPPSFTITSKFDLILVVTPDISTLDNFWHKAEAWLDASPSVYFAIPFNKDLVEDFAEIEHSAMITPPMVSVPRIEDLNEVPGLKILNRGLSKVSIGAWTIRRGIIGKRSMLFFMISSELYDRPFKLVTPSGSKIVTYASLIGREVEPIVHVDLKLKNGKIVPDKILRILDLIDNKGNLTRVAEILNTTYQNISQTVRRYENMLGIKLIDSTPGKGGGAQLTPDGKKLVALRRDIISNVETK